MENEKWAIGASATPPPTRVARDVEHRPEGTAIPAATASAVA
jgi:hypothetical protein